MAGWDDVRRLALELKAALGDAAPSGPVLAAYVEDVGAKDAMIAAEPGAYFTTPHFDGYAG